MTSVQAGEVEAVHEVTTANVLEAAPRAGRGPDRHPDDGAAVHLPLQRELDHEPDPRDVPRATAEIANKIDIERALAAKERAERRLQEMKQDNIDFKRAELALQRALNRLSVSGKK